jgi:exodeoxyribonuclease VII large subunit
MKKMFIKVLSVSALNNYIKKIMDNDVILNNVYISGEISNFKLHDSGHMYFSLKDEFGKINAVMFKGNVANVQFIPQNGMNVEVKGRVSVYTKDGSYQLYCDSMKQVGLGELYIAFNKLKDKLLKDGLFDEANKKPIPRFPNRIGVITSPTGAAVRDIINVATRRNKNVDILLYPARVQGEGASNELIKGIKYLNTLEDVEVIILGRGGGSIEELWAFNDEALAYAIFNSRIPVVTGVGHETDYTIVDFVSDRRAATPSAAAEIVVPSIQDINNEIEYLERTLNRVFVNSIEKKKNQVIVMKKTLEVNNPLNYVINAFNFIDNLKVRLSHNIDMRINLEKEAISKLNAVLQAQNPLNVLNRGYAVIQDKNSDVINDIEILKEKKEIQVTLKNGSIKGKVDFS